MLFSGRKREQEYRKREAAGVTLWSSEFDEAVRRKLVFAYVDSLGTVNPSAYHAIVRGKLLRHLGVPYLARNTSDDFRDIEAYLLTADDELIPDILEAMAECLQDERLSQSAGNWGGYEFFALRVAVIFRTHRIAFELIETEMTPFSSRVMHEHVVVPALSLLGGRTQFAKVETAFVKALEEITRGDAPDAITDAGTALQELLQALGCSGSTLGQLIRDAAAKRLIEPHDVKLLDWVSAERSQSGDSHNVTDVHLEDAWLIVHVVGAIALRLAS